MSCGWARMNNRPLTTFFVIAYFCFTVCELFFQALSEMILLAWLNDINNKTDWRVSASERRRATGVCFRNPRNANAILTTGYRNLRHMHGRRAN